MNVAALVEKYDAALRKVGGNERLVYKRAAERTGGDSLIGRGVTVEKTDTLLDPQPMYERIDAASVMQVSSKRVSVGDYELTVSPTALSVTELKNSDISIVLKNGADEEVFKVVDYDPIAFNQAVISITVWVRSVAR